VYEKFKEFKIDDKFIILDVFKPKDWYNAAHYAAEYLIQNTECEEIHLWGCDSIFENTVSSTTGKLIQQSTQGDSRFIRNWRRVWNEIHIENPEVHFVAMRMPK
jgi:hypothetical protein